ncbi:MAG: ABC transporter ATP-binding protein [Candidatus Omnitrophica bacterium]|nr:ABC transporter ATP-binding protein [Candidatus Omnitrophota bacterium]
MTAPLLSASHLTKRYPYRPGLLRQTKGWIHAVDGVSLEIFPGETAGLVGESGCGKSTLAKLLAGLLAPTQGSVFYKGKPLNRLTRDEKREFQCSVQFVFQSSSASLNPRMRIGDSIAEPLRIQKRGTARTLRKTVSGLLEEVGLEAGWSNRLPGELSGGQRQRVAIARALALRPALILCDEPVASLDAVVQKQIIHLLEKLQAGRGMAYLIISHNLETVAAMADRVDVMYLGRIVETSSAQELFDKPMHPYTQALLAVSPIQGEPCSALKIPSGCRYHPRCPKAEKVCSQDDPALLPRTDGRISACHFA